MTSDENAWYRQIGIVDQNGVASLDKTIDGDDDGIVSLLVMSDQLGAFRSGRGSVRINRDPEKRIRLDLSRGFVNPLPMSWLEVKEYFSGRGMSVHFDHNATKIDLWVGKSSCINGATSAEIWAVHGNGRALLGSGSTQDVPRAKPPRTMLDPASLVCCTASILHRLLAKEGLFWKEAVSDRWLTLTVRVDDLDPSDALEEISSEFGRGTSALTADGSGSLIRFRIPVEKTPFELVDVLQQSRIEPDHTGTGISDIGPIPAVSEHGRISFSGEQVPALLTEGDFLILGAGGTGSWASSLILGGCDNGVSITIIDGDAQVEKHNLNRQVLYQNEDLGKPKADAAKEALTRRFPESSTGITSIPIHLGPHHTSTSSLDENEEMSFEAISACGADHNQRVRTSLDDMGVALACLDNQAARTWLNKACLERGKAMVNGGSEGLMGVVECFEGDSCMVCRYGEREATSSEVVSCQEEGTRPVPSIVTSTAYVGAMMAAMALCVVARERSEMATIPPDRNWSSGAVQIRQPGRLPWFDGSCLSHL